MKNENESMKYEKYHMGIEQDNNFVYLKMYNDLSNIKDGDRLQSLLMDITNYGDLNVVTYTTSANIDTEWKFRDWWDELQKECALERCNEVDNKIEYNKK